MAMQKYDVISFRQTIPPLGEGFYGWIVPAVGTVEDIFIYFPQGQEGKLQLWPVIIQSGSEVPTDIILAAPGTNKYLSGDDYEINRKVTRPLTPGDEIRVYYKNAETVYNMDMFVDVSIDYYADNRRVV